MRCDAMYYCNHIAENALLIAQMSNDLISIMMKLNGTQSSHHEGTPPYAVVDNQFDLQSRRALALFSG